MNPIGQLFGRLTAQEEAAPQRYLRSDGTVRAVLRRVVCRCACGKRVTVGLAELRSGNTTSCGCLARELTRDRSEAHGHSSGQGGRPTPTYNSWGMAKQRCTNPNYPSYEQYGARGITMCARWLDSFENFLADMGTRPAGKTLDRKDNDGPYDPENCRWAKPSEQSRNTSRNVNAVVDGAKRCVTDLAAESGVSRNALTRRLKAGWPVERALTRGRLR